MKKFLIPIFSIPVLFPKMALAHCPLCTAGAGALAIFAASLGVSSIIVGIFIGAFSLALGLWIAPMVKKEYVPYQKQILTALILLGTFVPIMPLIRDYGPLYLSLWGPYGTLFHNTYTIDLFVFGGVMGAIIMLVSPSISRFISRVRGKQIPFQGISITLLLLIILSLIVQLLS